MVRSHQMKHMLRRKPMTCVSTARQMTEPVRFQATLCSHIGTLGILSSSGTELSHERNSSLHRSPYCRA